MKPRRDRLSIVIVGAGPIEQELRAQAARLACTMCIFSDTWSEEDKVALLTLCYRWFFLHICAGKAFGISLLEGAM